jgi:hypothetical protein
MLTHRSTAPPPAGQQKVAPPATRPTRDARIAAARGRHPYDQIDPQTLYQIEQFRVLSFWAQKYGLDIWAFAPLTREPNTETCDRLMAQLRDTRLPAVHHRYLLGLLMERDPRVPPLLKPLLRKELKLDRYGRRDIGKPGVVERALWYRSQHPDASWREIARYLDLDHRTVRRWVEAGLFVDLEKPEG